MKPIAIIVVLFIVGVAGAWLYLKSSYTSSTTPPTMAAPTPAKAPQDKANATGAGQLHGGETDPQAKLCTKHRIPDSVDAFCHPELVESLGFCSGHNVPEAFCTQCSPVLIAAFKVEGDWCEEHGLPESQCAICKGQSQPGST